MSLLRLTNGFDRMPDTRIIERASFIVTQMRGNKLFQDPTPKLEDVQASIDSLSNLVKAAGTGDKQAILERNAGRDALANMLHNLGYYVLFISAGDRVAAASSGFRLAKTPAPQPPLSKPQSLKVENTSQSGELRISVKNVKGAVAYMYQYTTDANRPEESWQSMNCTVSKCQITGLTPGALYYCRVVVLGRKEQTMYSDTVSRIAA